MNDIQYVATVLTVYGIETVFKVFIIAFYFVATVLTVYGIETEETAKKFVFVSSCNSTYRLRY